MLLPNLGSLSIHTESVDGFLDELPVEVLRKIEKSLPVNQRECFELLLRWRVSTYRLKGDSADTMRFEIYILERTWSPREIFKRQEVQLMVDAIANAAEELSSSGFKLLKKNVETTKITLWENHMIPAEYTSGAVSIDVNMANENTMETLASKFFLKYCEDGRGDVKLYFLKDVSKITTELDKEKNVVNIDMPCRFCHDGRPGWLHRNVAKSLKSHEE